MPITYRIFQTLLLVTAISSNVNAQDRVTSVDARFLFLDESPSSYSIEGNSGYRVLSSYPYQVSPPVTFDPQERVDLYKSARKPERSTPSGKPISNEARYQKIGTATIPSNVSEVLVVVRKDSEDAGAYRLEYFSSDPREFPEGTVRVINLGRTPIAVGINRERALMAPGQQRIMSPTPDHKDRLIIRVAEGDKNTWNILYDSVAVLRPGKRMTGVIVYSPTGMRHTYTAYELREFGEPEPGHQWLTFTD